MKIESSNVCFEGRHTLTELSHKKENLQLWVGSNPNQEMNEPSGVTVEISEKGKGLQGCLSTGKAQCTEDDMEDMLSEKDKQKLALLEAFIEHLLGKKFKFRMPKKIKGADEVKTNQNSGISRENRTPAAGWGLIYDSKTIHYENEKMSFKANGIVKTADGKEILIDIQLNMSREFMSSQEIHIRAGDALRKDPLVINFNAPSATLTDNKFSFDIDCDGMPDQISQLISGCGFLSVDLDNDGIINDGNELFGPKSGDGFADLSAYDLDNNGWIDENDAIFEKLRIWTKDEDGNDILFALGEKGIGAICLGNAGTIFSLRDKGNAENGVIQKTGIFLYENGGLGTVQHVDLIV